MEADSLIAHDAVDRCVYNSIFGVLQAEVKNLVERIVSDQTDPPFDLCLHEVIVLNDPDTEQHASLWTLIRHLPGNGPHFGVRHFHSQCSLAPGSAEFDSLMKAFDQCSASVDPTTLVAITAVNMAYEFPCFVLFCSLYGGYGNHPIERVNMMFRSSEEDVALLETALTLSMTRIEQEQVLRYMRVTLPIGSGPA